MHHLCPHPSGPVTIDPHPSTFSDTPFLFIFFITPPSAFLGRLGMSAGNTTRRVGVFLFSALPRPRRSLTFPPGRRGAGRTRRPEFFFPCLCFRCRSTRRKVEPFRQKVRCNWHQRTLTKYSLIIEAQDRADF